MRDRVEDLRREVRALATSRKSDAEIKQYLVARYGDFVLYKPPVQRNTWFLWLGPFVLLAGGAGVWYAIVRRRRDEVEVPPADDAVTRARQMIYEEP